MNSSELAYLKMELAGCFDDFRDLNSLLYHIMLLFVSSVLRQERGEVGQAEPINTVVPAVAREMHNLGFDQDMKEKTGFPTFKCFSG